MKRYLASFSVVIFSLFCSGQKGFGFDLGMSTSKAPMVDVKYFFDDNAASVGVSYQVFNDALGKKSGSLLPGTSAIGDGSYFYSIDFGYTRILTERFAAAGELSIAKKYHYQNLSYDNSPQSSYHRILDTDSKVGVGAILIYTTNIHNIGLFAGYNSIRKAVIGLELRFLHQD